MWLHLYDTCFGAGEKNGHLADDDDYDDKTSFEAFEAVFEEARKGNLSLAQCNSVCYSALLIDLYNHSNQS